MNVATADGYPDFVQILRRPTDLVNEVPSREELFSVERLEQYAAHLAGELRVDPAQRRGRSLLSELKRNDRELQAAYLQLAAAIRGEHAVSPAAEWFVDNFHVVQDQLREIRRDLPAGYYSGLPKLSGGALEGYPRVYALALALIAHTDSRLDASTLRRFLEAFQRHAPLRIGELWAVPITLRIVLIERLTPRALRIVSARKKREEADELADQVLALLAEARGTPEELIRFLSRELGDPEGLDRAFIVQLIQRIRDQDPDVCPLFRWLEGQLEGRATSAQKVTQIEHRRQAASQVTVGNIIASMRLLSTIDWGDFVESVSLADRALARDPAGAYLRMDFATRDQYRHAVERIARRSGASELDIAARAVERAARWGEGEPGAHVGHDLLGPGREEFEREFGVKLPIRERILRRVRRHATRVYLGTLVGFTALFLAPALWWFVRAGGSPAGAAAFALLALLPASEMALSLLHHYVGFFIRPVPLPRMETRDGIPGEGRTLVVIPALLSHGAGVRELVDRLEIHFLGNPDPNLSFALLGDFADAPAETMPEDERLLRIARAGIDALNERYRGDGAPRFYLFHRRRLWNSAEGSWIGWERKRGKLLELNRLLRGAQDTSYAETASAERLAGVQYVLTLDSDTQLPRDAARLLVGTLLHPLNRPRIDPRAQRVTAGYGILQPRISVAPSGVAASRFARISSGNIGLDLYTTAVSDVYQDLFGEGSFTGKGLYAIDAFELAMAGRVPENAVLSHDLFEGACARSALVTDVELFDDYPADYDTFSQRQHRWTRGDWQIAPWCLPWVPDSRGGWIRNALPFVSRWKILDNVRRSLVAPSALLWLALAWTALPGPAEVWTALLLLMFLFPVYSTFTTDRWLRRRGLSWRGHVASGLSEARIKAGQVLLTAAFLAQQAWTQVDAIVRSLYRMVLSRRKLLEWVSYAQLLRRVKVEPSLGSLREPGPVLALLIGAAVAFFRPAALPAAAPFLLAWLLGPWLKRWLAARPAAPRPPLGEPERADLRRYARLTWHFFETFVGPEDSYLAPDNFQQDPKPAVAHRTSPTNIGLQLLSTAAAYDLGYLGRRELLDLLERIFATLQRLPRLEGHLFNWYDTRTLEPLHPRYISTVDSGNLAGHLLALKQFLLELGRAPRPLSACRQGLADTLGQLYAEAVRIPTSSSADAAGLRAAIRDAIRGTEAAPEGASEAWRGSLQAAAQRLGDGMDILDISSTDQEDARFSPVRAWLEAAIRQIQELQRDADASAETSASRLLLRQSDLAARCEEIALGMDFRFLFDERRKLFAIGYNAADGRMDASFYDLLASESRLASFVAIAKGDVPQEHWFRLGRPMTAAPGGRALIAWTATMFEYLMPVLVMRRYGGTLLDETYEAIVRRQIEYGRQRGVPWGVSESGYNARDLQLSYQYKSFGVPGLGLKRGLSDELVVSPYSTLLAALIDPWAAIANLRRLERLGVLARFGFFESIDYTAARLPPGSRSAVLQSFMAHHQGMILAALDDILCDCAMQRRFHAEPLVQSAELLLQEKIPRLVELSRPRAEEVLSMGYLHAAEEPFPRSLSDVHLSSPRTQLLSNGSYSVMVTSAGSGYSRCAGLAINRWREDPTTDSWGSYFYIRDRSAGRVWSAARQPAAAAPDSLEVRFAEEKVELLRRDGVTLTRAEILVSPEDNVELRRISLTNESGEAREYEVTSFLELALAAPADDAAHPAFSKLFVQTERLPSEDALVATRRLRSPAEVPAWAFHVLVTEGEAVGPVQYETDRARFLGRGRGPADPLVIQADRALSGTLGSVLDPIFSLRRAVRVGPGETARITFATGLARSREELVRLVDKYHDTHIFEREARLAWTQAQVQLRHLNLSAGKAHAYQQLAGRMIYLDGSLRARPSVLALNRRAQSGLWAYGISGDVPILLTRISDEKDMAMVRELLRAHEYLRLKGLAIDLVILNERPVSYFQSLEDELQRQIRMSGSNALLDRPGGVFLRRSDLMPEEDVLLLRAVARVSLNADRGTLEEQLERRSPRPGLPPRLVPAAPAPGRAAIEGERPQAEPLEFDNGIGGFTPDGREYVIRLRGGEWTPAPWINVIANERGFGFLVSEAGSGCAWAANSRENRITPWSNDPVSDPAGEAIYLRDEETGEVWTPTPLPIREEEPYVVRHGQGYTRFEHTSHGIKQQLDVFAAADAGVKISRLRLTNLGAAPRRISVASYAEWVLGVHREASAPHVITEIEPETGAILARNPYNDEFASQVAFAHISEPERSFTCDRREFLGRNGSLARPRALERAGLSGATGAGMDPCAAFFAPVELAPGAEREIRVLLGEAESLEEARGILLAYRGRDGVESGFQEVLARWDEVLGAVAIQTPDRAMDLLCNRWLPYQTLACRVWARAALYQSGGAFGFRDQLQDVMALVYSRPEIAREQILRAAARQFVEGDVQHWWHPPTGRGVRTRFSDDLLWLPFVASFYVEKTGDIGVLDERVPFIEAPALAEGRDDHYQLPVESSESGTILEHCARAIDRSLRVGSHGLPLMGSGDWNDGMNRVGNQGRGESVWVGWFLHAVIERLLPHCDRAGESARAAAYRAHLPRLRGALEEHAWDGDWYCRAFFDDGTPLGSAANEECRIDSIAQSWAVLSGAGDRSRAARAMDAVDERLVRREEGLIQLFAPPFDKTDLDPGYIKGYVPGVRENGGQYTHAAIWALMAFAQLGSGERAAELFALLNPINRAATPADVRRYKVEPYVIAADVYGRAPHVGRGGWTWYTGSSSWMYRAAIESILGFELRGDRLRVRPTIPKGWPGFEITYRRAGAMYRIEVIQLERLEGEERSPEIELDGERIAGEWIPLADDRGEHRVRILF